MNEEEQRFENFLREFEPRRPRALPADSEGTLQWRRVAAAAVLTVSLGSFAWFTFRTKHPVAESPSAAELTQRGDAWQKLTLTRWTRLAEEDPKEFDIKLNEASRKSLPSFNESNSLLRVLAKP